VAIAAATLRSWHPHLQIDAYLAMRSHDWFSFHELDLGD
jgi:hypothetical protein